MVTSEYAVILLSSLLLTGSVAFAGTCPSNVPSGVTSCFYADYGAGADTNSGASEAAPWKHVPGMKGCASNCAANTPAGGSGYILKGGVVWTNAALGWNFPYSGSSGSPVYVGDDPAWNAGVVNAIIPTSSGYNCSAISVSVSGGGGSGAAGTANFQTSNYLAGLLQHVTLTNQGSGYTSNPTVSFAGSTCSVLPTAIADIQRPVIDATGTTWNETNGAISAYGPVVFYGNYQTIDHLEIRGMLVDHSISQAAGSLYMVTEVEGTNDVFEGLYLHNFGPDSINLSGSPSFSGTGGFNIDQGVSGIVTVSNSYLDNYENEVFVPCGFLDNGSQANFTPPCGSSLGIVGATNLTNNIIHDSRGQVYTRAISGLNYSGNLIWNSVYDCCEQHEDTFYFFGAGVVSNNVIHDASPLGSANFYIETCQGNPCTVGNTTYVFNNVAWNVGRSTEGAIAFTSEFWGTSSVSPTPSLYAWNNTLYSYTGTTSCIAAIQFYGNAPTAGINFNLYNNQCISDQTGAMAFALYDPTDCTVTTNCGVWNGLTNPNGTAAQTALNGANTVMTPATATSQSYVISNQFAPTSSSSGTVTASGTNLTATSPGCGTAGLSGLCSAMRGASRPSSGTWNIGAYQYNSNAVPSSPTSLVATPW